MRKDCIEVWHPGAFSTVGQWRQLERDEARLNGTHAPSADFVHKNLYSSKMREIQKVLVLGVRTVGRQTVHPKGDPSPSVRFTRSMYMSFVGVFQPRAVEACSM